MCSIGDGTSGVLDVPIRKPLFGFRAFRIVERGTPDLATQRNPGRMIGRLRAVHKHFNKGGTWPSKVNKADERPSPLNRSGLYAATMAEASLDTARVIAVVAGWGPTVLHSFGFRSHYQRLIGPLYVCRQEGEPLTRLTALAQALRRRYRLAVVVTGGTSRLKARMEKEVKAMSQKKHTTKKASKGPTPKRPAKPGGASKRPTRPAAPVAP